MTVKKKPPIKNKTSVIVNAGKDEDQDEAVAKKLTRPEVQASLTIQKLHPINDVNALTKILSQAHTLDALFNNLVMKGLDQTHMPHYESFLRLAYKAQSQCRSTLQTLSDIKNPSVVYAKQANITNGNQQINNGVSTPRTQENINYSNELLTELPNETLDSRRTIEAIPVNSELATVE